MFTWYTDENGNRRSDRDDGTAVILVMDAYGFLTGGEYTIRP